MSIVDYKQDYLFKIKNINLLIFIIIKNNNINFSLIILIIYKKYYIKINSLNLYF